MKKLLGSSPRGTTCTQWHPLWQPVWIEKTAEMSEDRLYSTDLEGGDVSLMDFRDWNFLYLHKTGDRYCGGTVLQQYVQYSEVLSISTVLQLSFMKKKKVLLVEKSCPETPWFLFCWPVWLSPQEPTLSKRRPPITYTTAQTLTCTSAY